MELVYRLDKLKVGKAFRTDSGALIAPARLTRVGIFEYRNADGSVRRELRPPEEVFSSKSLETLQGVPVTVEHPGVVTPDNFKATAVGHVREAHPDGEFIGSTIRVDEWTAIQGLESKALEEVSCGYRCQFDPTPGVYKGERYDGVQRNITYNHLALLRGSGRAGPECRVTLDGNDYLIVQDNTTLGNREMDPKELEKLINRAVDAEKARDTLQGRCDALESENSTLKTKVEGLEAERLDEKDIAARVDARVSLVAVAKAVMGKDYAHAGKSDHEVRLDCVKKIDSKLRLDGKSEAYVEGVFESLASKVDLGGEATKQALAAVDSARADANYSATASGTTEKSPIKLAIERRNARTKERNDAINTDIKKGVRRIDGNKVK